MSQAASESAFCATREVVMAAVEESRTHLDSGCSRSMFGHLAWFDPNSYKDETRRIYLGDGSHIESVGCGTVKLDFGTHSITLLSALHVPNLAGNLVSISHLDSSGVATTFSHGRCTLHTVNPARTLAVIPIRSNLYPLDVFPTERVMAAADETISEELAHRRMGHVGVSRIRRTAAHLSDLNLESARLDECIACIEGKMTRRTFKASTVSRSTQCGDVVSIDLFGPLPPTSSGFRYGLVVVDDHSSYCKLYLLKNKSDASACLERFFDESKRQGRTIKVVRSDGGGESLNARTDEILVKRGILRKTTAPHTPEQNGQAERAVRTIKEGLRTMLLQAGFGASFWGQAARAFVHARNRSVVRGRIPLQVWSGKPSTVSHLRVFGCTAWVQLYLPSMMPLTLSTHRMLCYTLTLKVRCYFRSCAYTNSAAFASCEFLERVILVSRPSVRGQEGPKEPGAATVIACRHVWSRDAVLILNMSCQRPGSFSTRSPRPLDWCPTGCKKCARNDLDGHCTKRTTRFHVSMTFSCCLLTTNSFIPFGRMA